MAQVYPQLTTYPEREKTLKILVWVFSVIVLLLVGLMRRPEFKIPVPDSWDLTFLPAVNATLNALTAVALVFSLYFIKQGKIILHRNANAVALGLSVLFLLCYVAYHFTTMETIYGDADGDGILSAAEIASIGGMRTVYLFILLTHIVLAGVLLPFILLTTVRALVGKYAAHKKLSRVVWPLWLYVALTGPVVYLMLRQYYP